MDERPADDTLAEKREALRQAMKLATVQVYAPEYYDRRDADPLDEGEGED